MNRVPPHLRPLCFLSIFSSCAARPPHETGPFHPSELVKLTRLDPTIRLDIRYATSPNFMSRVLYSQARAFLQRPATEALARVNAALQPLGYYLLVFDDYRHWRITKQMWKHTPADKKEFVANPQKGSRHNRGCAVGLSLWDITANKEVAMAGNYNEMSPRSHVAYPGGTTEQKAHRDLLRSTTEHHGFTVLPTEWWHFDYRGWKSYSIEDIPFNQL